jgi:hypothetical protein
MALQKTLQLVDNFGEQITILDAYIKVESVAGNKEMVSYDLAIYRVKDGQKLTTFKHEFAPEMQGGNFIEQAYLDAKKLPEHVGAKDC